MLGEIRENKMECEICDSGIANFDDRLVVERHTGEPADLHCTY
jgi:hypothetical protein